ncbi:MAG: D-glycero-beta-D-manno-heptose-7-phosphate kinase [Deltaproteobacteria bacterium]
MNNSITQKRLKKILTNFPQARVLVVGDIILDHFIKGTVSRISPEAPVPVVNVANESFLLGGSANVINNIVSAGGKVFCSGVIGNDEMGKKIIEELRSKGIDTSGIVKEKQRQTTVKSRIIANRQQVVRFDKEDKHALAPRSIENIIKYIQSISYKLDAIVISDYGKGVITEELLLGIKQNISGKNIPVCIDPKKSNFAFYEGFDIITPNTLEAIAAAGINTRDSYDIVQVGRSLLASYDFKALLITRSDEGMSLFEKKPNKSHSHFPTQAREVFDVTGAGDTVIAILALSLASGATLHEAVMLANYAAGIVVGKTGTATASLIELSKML